MYICPFPSAKKYRNNQKDKTYKTENWLEGKHSGDGLFYSPREMTVSVSFLNCDFMSIHFSMPRFFGLKLLRLHKHNNKQ